MGTPTYNDAGAQYRDRKIRERVPRPAGETRSRNAAVCILLADQGAALAKAEQASWDAYQACDRNLDPSTDHDERERAYTKLENAQAAHVKATAKVIAELEENREAIIASDREQTAAEVEEALALLDKVEVILTEQARRK